AACRLHLKERSKATPKASRQAAETCRLAACAPQSRESLQSHRRSDALHHFAGLFIRPGRAPREHGVDVIRIRQNLFPTLSHWSEIFPEPLEKLLLEITVASPAPLECLARCSGLVLAREKRVELKDCRGGRILCCFHRL